MKTQLFISSFAFIFLISAQLVAQSKTVKASIKVYGNCEMCKARIETALDRTGAKMAAWTAKGPNTMISIENMPGVRGLASSQGIQLIPGTWINSIEVTKGVGPVVNGYESIAGQINCEKIVCSTQAQARKPRVANKIRFMQAFRY